MDIIYEFIDTPEDHDSRNVFFKIDGKVVGYGYQGKSDGKIHVQRCPQCGDENWAIAIAQGNCAWCNYNPNEKGHTL